MASVKNAAQKTNCCHDCQKEIAVDGDKITNGVFLVYDTGAEKLNILKCQECYEKSPSMTNYQTCEVYSRIVGYLRPIQQWNPSKQEEFRQRKEYAKPKVS